MWTPGVLTSHVSVNTLKRNNAWGPYRLTVFLALFSTGRTPPITILIFKSFLLTVFLALFSTGGTTSYYIDLQISFNRSSCKSCRAPNPRHEFGARIRARVWIPLWSSSRIWVLPLWDFIQPRRCRMVFSPTVSTTAKIHHDSSL